jgi:hypothetical protein
MANDTQRGKKGKTPRTSKKKSAEAAAPMPAAVPASRMAEVKVLTRGILGKGAYDAAAKVVRNAILYGGTSLIVVVAGYFLGIDIRPYLRWPPQLEAAPKPISPVPDEAAKKREIDFHVANAREKDALVGRRKAAWAAYEKCKVDWTAGWDEKQTAETACLPKLNEHRELAKQVKEREAKDCSAAAMVPK